jgi:hypothetical protein
MNASGATAPTRPRERKPFGAVDPISTVAPGRAPLTAGYAAATSRRYQSAARICFPRTSGSANTATLGSFHSSKTSTRGNGAVASGGT